MVTRESHRLGWLRNDRGFVTKDHLQRASVTRRMMMMMMMMIMKVKEIPCWWSIRRATPCDFIDDSRYISLKRAYMYIMYIGIYVLCILSTTCTTTCLISDVMKAPQNLGSPQFVPRKCDSYGEGHTFPTVNKEVLWIRG